jgi:hypothetical protein
VGSARELLPAITEQDPKLTDVEAAERQLDASVLALRDIRSQYGYPEFCS